MFGSSVEHVRGVFDSEEEKEVARILIEMRRERYVSGILPHPKVAGVTADFLVQLGPETENSGEIVLLEYDGLGIDRPRGLETKRQRYRRLSREGLPARWLIDPSREAIKEALVNYSPPHFALRRDVCECGDVESHVVIAPEEMPGEFSRDVTCDSCTSKQPQKET